MDTSQRVKRRIWSDALKREIVAAAAAPGASVCIVARRYDVNTNLVFTWRKLYGAGGIAVSTPHLVRVMVMADHPVTRRPAPTSDRIEIGLPGARLRVGPNVKTAALRLVLDALARR
jgi:transposase